MRLLPDALQYRIPALCALFALVVVTVVSALVGVQQYRLLQEQMDDFGEAQARQLALAAEQPLFMRDVVSLQVIVENSAASDKVFQTRIRDADERVLAESSRSRNAGVDELRSYPAQVVLEGETIGAVDLLLDRPLWAGLYLAPWYRLIALGLLAVVATAAASFLLARRFTGHLSRLVASLPVTGDDAGGNELQQLEHRLEPLLTRHGGSTPVEDDDTRNGHYALVACQLTNLARLRAQLNHENYQQQLHRFDETLERVCRLYQGERLRGRYGTALLRFAASDSEADQLQRALYAAHLLGRYLAESSPDTGISLEIRLALCQGYYDPEVTPLLQEQQDNDLEDRLFDMLDLGAAGEILLSADVAAHPQLADMGESEEFSDQDAVFRWLTFVPERQGLIDKQMQFLRSAELR